MGRTKAKPAGRTVMRCRSWERRARVNVNIQAVQDRLEERVRKGRTPLEGAGELRQLAELQWSQEVLSNETHKEMIQVVDEWLATKR